METKQFRKHTFSQSFIINVKYEREIEREREREREGGREREGVKREQHAYVAVQ